MKAYDWAGVGETGVINGITYTIVDRPMLESLVGGSGGSPQNVKNICTSRITSMYRLFYYKSQFNQPIASWDVSNVISMYEMFYGARSFNQDLSSWSVNNVVDCRLFSFNTTAWTLPKPNFTNC